MGNNTSLINKQTCLNQSKDIELQITSMGNRTSSYFGNIQIWRIRNSKQKLFSKVIRTSLKEDTHLREHQSRCNVQHPNLIQYYGCKYDYFSIQSDMQELTLYYEYLPYTLEKVIEDYQKDNTYPIEAFVQKIINQMAQVTTYLETFQLHNSAIHTRSIFIDDNIKILYHQAYPSLISSYAKAMAGIKFEFLSPEQMDDLKNSRLQQTDDPLKSDAYAFGMTLLELCSLKPSSQFYDYLQKKIHHAQVIIAVNQLKQRYSSRIIDIIQKLLQQNPIDRSKISNCTREPIFRQNRFQQTTTNTASSRAQSTLQTKKSQVVTYLSPQQSNIIPSRISSSPSFSMIFKYDQKPNHWNNQMNANNAMSARSFTDFFSQNSQIQTAKSRVIVSNSRVPLNDRNLIQLLNQKHSAR